MSPMTIPHPPKRKNNIMKKIPADILARWRKEDLDDIAEIISGMTFFMARGCADPTVKELYPNLTEKELDYVMSKYTGHLARGERKKKKIISPPP